MNVTKRAGPYGNTYIISKIALINISHVTFFFFPVMFPFVFSRFGFVLFFSRS